MRKLFFSTPTIQKLLAQDMVNKELALFVKDDEGNWEKCSDLDLDLLINSRDQVYYMMLGTSIGEWVFAPSMEHLPFSLNGIQCTVIRLPEKYSYYFTIVSINTIDIIG